MDDNSSLPGDDIMVQPPAGWFSNACAMKKLTDEWKVVAQVGEIDEEDVMQFDYGDRTFAVYNTEQGYFATDGLCTHEDQHLADGLVIDDVIECPLHQGRFHIPTGKAMSAPVCIDLKTYPVQVADGKIHIRID